MTSAVNTFEVSVVSGPTSSGTVSDWELHFARRALATLKERLGTEAILKLIAPDVDAGNKAISEWAANSNGKWQPAVTKLRVSGLSTTAFLSYLESISHDQPKMLAAQPEHFVYQVTEAGGLSIIERFGLYITHLNARYTDEDVVGEVLPDYPTRLVGKITVPDGTLIAHFQHQFRDTDTGFDAALGLYFPAAAPEEAVEGHRKHLAVEFTNWIKGAAESLGLSPAGV